MQRGHIGRQLLGEAYGQDIRQVICCTHISFKFSWPAKDQHMPDRSGVPVTCRGAFRRVSHCQRQAPDSGEANNIYSHDTCLQNQDASHIQSSFRRRSEKSW